MAKPPDDHIAKNDRSVWKGLVVDPNEFTPPKPTSRWMLLVVLLGLVVATLVVLRVLL